MNAKNNSFVITIVVCTVCILALVGVTTEALCAIYKIPDMSGSLSSGFTHCIDTIVGALIALLINTRAQETRKDDPLGLPTEVKVVNTEKDSVPTTETK